MILFIIVIVVTAVVLQSVFVPCFLWCVLALLVTFIHYLLLPKNQFDCIKKWIKYYIAPICIIPDSLRFSPFSK